MARYFEQVTGGRVYQLLGGFAFVSAIAFIACDVILWGLAPGYDPVSDTISRLAAGPFSWVMDGAMIIFALGVLALTIGFVFCDDDDAKSWVMRACLVLLASTMLPLALLNNYSKHGYQGIVLHPYLVTLLGVLVAVLLWFAPTKAARRSLPVDPRVMAALWVLTAPLLDFVPDDMEGAYERMLMWMLMAAVATAAFRLFQEKPSRIIPTL